MRRGPVGGAGYAGIRGGAGLVGTRQGTRLCSVLSPRLLLSSSRSRSSSCGVPEGALQGNDDPEDDEDADPLLPYSIIHVLVLLPLSALLSFDVAKQYPLQPKGRAAGSRRGMDDTATPRRRLGS